MAVEEAGGLSLHENFLWSLIGMVIYAACQWGMIVAIAKMGNSIMVGQFSLGLAISTPVIMFTNLQLRPVQATDATRQHPFGEYFGLRLVMTLIAAVVIASIVGIVKYQHATAMVILAVAAAKTLESLSDIFYGVFQLNDRLDQTGKSMMLRGTFSLAGLGAALWLTRDVFWGVVGLAAVWLVVLISFDARRAQRFVILAEGTANVQTGWRSIQPKWSFPRQRKLAQCAFPLGVVMMLVSLNLNMPRYFVAAHLGEDELGIFSALAYTTVAVAMVADALGHSAMPRLSRLYCSGLVSRFRILLLKLLAAGTALGVAGVAVAHVGGSRLLTILFNPKYGEYSHVFVCLVIAASVSCAAFLLTAGITSAQCFRVQVPMFALVVGINALLCALLVPAGGLLGAAEAVLGAAMVHFVLAAAVIFYLLNSREKGAAKTSTAPAYGDSWEPGL